MTRSNRGGGRQGARNQFRIIGGRWRGRRLPFPAEGGIRPTPDRVRETLFNWLQPRIESARCLDLFAGSGALGLEALSRGAAQVIFVERNAGSVTALEQNLSVLAAPGHVKKADAFDFLQSSKDTFDLVFLDPPFADGHLMPALKLLQERCLLASDALVYVEAARGELAGSLPPGWRLHKRGKAGQVEFGLASIGTDSEKLAQSE